MTFDVTTTVWFCWAAPDGAAPPTGSASSSKRTYGVVAFGAVAVVFT
jgi:hypothetical protein